MLGLSVQLVIKMSVVSITDEKTLPIIVVHATNAVEKKPKRKWVNLRGKQQVIKRKQYVMFVGSRAFIPHKLQYIT
jgi:hypothetical protein